MNENELRSAYEASIPILEAMGCHVQSRILDKIQSCTSLGNSDLLLKIPCDPRVKDVDSFLTKALHRGKNYTDPLYQIDDKVGLRFCVLYFHEIELIGSLVEEEASWKTSRDRDIEREIEADPHHFSYQSRHYVVHLCDNITHNNQEIPKGTTCEVQIRTLLQHAYAELAHDTTYKPTQNVSHHVVRCVAKGSALIETTDGVFEEVRNKIREEHHPIISLIARCERAYDEKIGEPKVIDQVFAANILKGYSEWIDEVTTESINQLFSELAWLAQRIRDRRIDSVFFKTEVCLAIYILVKNHPTEFPQKWPLDLSLLDYVYSDLGISPSW